MAAEHGGARLCAWTDGSMRWLCPSPGLSNFLSPRALNAAGPSLASASVDDVRVCLRFGERRRQGQSKEIGAASVPTRGVFGWWGCLARRRVVLDDQCRRRVGGTPKALPRLSRAEASPQGAGDLFVHRGAGVKLCSTTTESAKSADGM